MKFLNFLTNKNNNKNKMSTINKQEAKKQLEALKADVARLEAVINTPEDVKSVIASYGDPLDGIFQLAGTTRKAFYEKCEGDAEDEIGWKEIKLIAKVLNEGSKPEDNIYFPYFKKDKADFVCDSWDFYYVGFFSVSPLGRYKTSELAVYAGKTFEKSYNKWSGVNNK